MKKVIYTVIILKLTIFICLNGYSQNLRQLRVISSSKANVEQFFGKPLSKNGFTYTYDTPTFLLEVVYSDGHCNYNAWNDWDIKRWSVQAIFVFPKSAVKFSPKIKDENQLTINESRSDHKEQIYSNETKGVWYFIENGNVAQIQMRPPARDSNKLCFPPEENCFSRVKIYIEKSSQVEKNLGKVRPKHFTLTAGVVFPTGTNNRYKWTIDTGRIVGVDSSRIVKVDMSGVMEKSATATLEVSNYFGGKLKCRKLRKTLVKIQ